MINITFKDVGQGDSIILEWLVDDIKNYAIIDCNVDQNQNFVLNHISTLGVSKISFIILSHPHCDHYSGMHELLCYCEANNIQIGYFLHTSNVNPDVLKSACRSNIAANELIKLFRKIQNLEKSNVIGYVGYIDANTSRELELDGKVKLRFLLPTNTQYIKYVSSEQRFRDEENEQNNANANWLCTLIQIYSATEQVLLTSDAENEALLRIARSNINNIKTKTVLLCQSPHHGSKLNHSNVFWNSLKYTDKSKVIYSVGLNKYKHPSSESINFFNSKGLNIFSTNNLGGLLVKDNPESEKKRQFLNMNSTQVTLTKTKSNFSGDQSFSFF